jgi:hypothetical protein
VGPHPGLMSRRAVVQGVAPSAFPHRALLECAARLCSVQPPRPVSRRLKPPASSPSCALQHLQLCRPRALFVARAEDRLGTPAAFDVLHCQAPHHGRAASSTEPPGRHLLQHPAGVLRLTDISSDANDFPSGLPSLSTPDARTLPWTAIPGEPPSIPSPQISPLCRPGPPSPLLVNPRRRHHLDGRPAASLAWPRAMARRAPLFHIGVSAQCKDGPISWARLKANGKSSSRSAIS